ncbi:S8 family serine peptidase [Blastococcus sp. TML/M2B]|uniref:S8 family serine peptidase n=1 Tax=unclassified Blastococcus TaxID=2619396 RepID=UPI00190CB04C|nr:MULTISPECIES: S8 family serine peptidase [unclassified Blastococcus]MBN1094534.1 S8 family serine peptidase [Blastococcus sp. TML/M2B]MBN1095496.1 S8 family serine peptidase [Blastococcus sp. TML/C7B]
MRRSSRRLPRRLAGALSGAVVVAALTAPSASAAPPEALAPVQDFLADQLAGLAAGVPTTVLVHGTDIAAARSAVEASGLVPVTEFEKIGVVVASGTADRVEQARRQPGVTYLEGNAPIEFAQETSNTATRGAEAVATLTGADGSPLDGSGVSVAVIDSGVDSNHPYLRDPDGSSAVVASLKSLCLVEATPTTDCVVPVPTVLDTDTLSLGGHGTHVSGIVAGRPTTLSDGARLQGAAPGASLVSISTGAVLLIVGADSALNWVLENHEAPCGAGVSPEVCPPIKVTNNSYGPTGGGAFDPNSATVKLQRALAAEGVVTVWAAGNDGGDGSASLTNPPGQDPTGGILSVASYSDQETGTQDGAVSEFSSRGAAADPSTWPDLSAPGDTITSACRPYLPICATGLDFRNGPGLLDLGTFNTISGTSMAAPHIAGIVAQLFQADPTATPAEIEAALTGTAHRFGDGAPYVSVGGRTTSYDKGAGLVDVVAAVARLTGS